VTSLIRLAPAPYHTLVWMLAGDPFAHQKLVAPSGFAKLQLLAPGALSWAVWGGERPLACAGLMPLEPVGAARRFEAWFTCDPDLAPYMRGFVRLAQLTLRELPDNAIVVARVDPGHAPGEKLARLIGFRPGEKPGLWEWRS